MVLPCLTLSNIRYESRVKWSNPGKGVAPYPTPRCSSYWKGSLLVALDYGHQLYFTQLVLSLSALLAVISLLIFHFNCLVRFLFNFLSLVWSSTIFYDFEWLSVLLSTPKIFVLSVFMLMLGWLRNSLAELFNWRVNNGDCFLLNLFLMDSAVRRSCNSCLIEITFISRSFKIFWYKISISVFLLMLVYPWNK